MSHHYTWSYSHSNKNNLDAHKAARRLSLHHMLQVIRWKMSIQMNVTIKKPSSTHLTDPWDRGRRSATVRTGETRTTRSFYNNSTPTFCHVQKQADLLRHASRSWSDLKPPLHCWSVANCKTNFIFFEGSFALSSTNVKWADNKCFLLLKSWIPLVCSCNACFCRNFYLYRHMWNKCALDWNIHVINTHQIK